jgi:hypothetical protein
MWDSNPQWNGDIAIITGFFSPKSFFCFKLFFSLQMHFAEGENFLVKIVFVMEKFISPIGKINGKIKLTLRWSINDRE